MTTSIFSPEAMVTGGFRSQYRADSKLSVEFDFYFSECTDSGYCLDAPEAMAAGSMIKCGMGQPSPTTVYRKDH